MKLLGRDLRSTEAEIREVEQFFQSVFGMMHETDLFPAEPQDGAYEVVSVSTIQAQMENLLCVSCFFGMNLLCWFSLNTALIPFLMLLMASPQTSPINFQASVADRKILEWNCLFFNHLCHLSAAYGENTGMKLPYWSLSSNILHTHTQRTSNDAGVFMSSAVLVVCRHMVVVFPFLPAFTIKGTVC